MQGAKNVAATAKESAADIAASAISGKEKAKAIVQEKREKMTAHDPLEKDMATQRKEERIRQAEQNKHEAMELNAANKQATAATGTGTGAHSYSTTGVTGQSTATQHHGTGHPNGQTVEGVVGSHPIGTNTTEGHNTGHGTEHPTGQTVEGVVGSHPIGTNTGTGNTTAGHTPGYGTGADYH